MLRSSPETPEARIALFRLKIIRRILEKIYKEMKRPLYSQDSPFINEFVGLFNTFIIGGKEYNSSLYCLLSQAAKNSKDAEILGEFIKEIKKDFEILSEPINDNKKKKYEVNCRLLSKGFYGLTDKELYDRKNGEIQGVDNFNENILSVILECAKYFDQTKKLKYKDMSFPPISSVAVLSQEIVSGVKMRASGGGYFSRSRSRSERDRKSFGVVLEEAELSSLFNGPSGILHPQPLGSGGDG